MLRARLVLQTLLLLLITFEKPELSNQNYAGINIVEVIQQFKVIGPQQIHSPFISVPVLVDKDLSHLLSNSMEDIEAFNDRVINQSQLQFLEVIYRQWQMTKFRVKTMYEKHFLYNLEHLLDSLF